VIRHPPHTTAVTRKAARAPVESAEGFAALLARMNPEQRRAYDAAAPDPKALSARVRPVTIQLAQPRVVELQAPLVHLRSSRRPVDRATPNPARIEFLKRRMAAARAAFGGVIPGERATIRPDLQQPVRGR
jgi:hypothetical protein